MGDCGWSARPGWQPSPECRGPALLLAEQGRFVESQGHFAESQDGSPAAASPARAPAAGRPVRDPPAHRIQLQAFLNGQSAREDTKEIDTSGAFCAFCLKINAGECLNPRNDLFFGVLPVREHQQHVLQVRIMRIQLKLRHGLLHRPA